MNYKIGYTYRFEVHPTTPDEEDFKIYVESPTGAAIVKLPKLKFQLSKPGYTSPLFLECSVRGFDEDGLPILGHVKSFYVKQLYSEIYRRGEGFLCTITYVPVNPENNPYEIEDDNGLKFHIYDTRGILSRGQRIRCKVKSLSGKQYQIVRDENDKSLLHFISPQDLLEATDIGTSIRRGISILFRSIAFDIVRSEVAERNPQWPLTAAKIIREHLNDWFVTGQVRRRSLTEGLLCALRKIMLYLLEGSNYLNSLNREERQFTQNLLTEMVENLHPYEKALTLIKTNRENEFVEGLFDKLTRSGYLYHPGNQFAIMMLIFRVYPAKVSRYLNQIFESIFLRDLENWIHEPFRSAFVEQFDIYVRQARHEIDKLPLAENREQKERTETIITALALQIILSGEKASNLSRSLFYRYISLLRPLNASILLGKSFMALLGALPIERLEYATLREPMMMMTHATVSPDENFLSRLGNRFLYTNGAIDVSISEEGIEIVRNDEHSLRDQGGVEAVIPAGLMNWLKPQVRLNGIRNLNASKLQRLTEHDSWWSQIETVLFDDIFTQSNESELRKAIPGDEVWIVIDGVVNPNDNNPIFKVHIEEDGILPSSGILYRSDIIKYNLRQPQHDAFTTESGYQLGFKATVKTIASNGTLVFSLNQLVNDYIQQVLNVDSSYIAVITGTNQTGYSAISRDGIGLYLLDQEQTSRTFNVGDVVYFRWQNGTEQGKVYGYITEQSQNPEDNFNKNTAFYNLMHAIGAEPDIQETESLTENSHDYLSADTLREIVDIIRFRATGESDLVQAYDYLRFARLLANILGDNLTADKLSAHAKLLIQHQYFGINSRIDIEGLENVRDIATSDPLLSMIFRRIELVSWLGNAQHNGELFNITTNPTHELEGSIARMVLSYNMLLDSNDVNQNINNELKNHIIEKLNLNSETRTNKYYGSESKYLEFKTSLVYPARALGEKMVADPNGQLMHIMSRIAGFLNANGGRLYVGVNNDGYAVNMRDDFNYYKHNRVFTGGNAFEIRNMDQLCVFLENAVHNIFGATISRKIEISADQSDDNNTECQVVEFKVAESLEPVYLEGRLWVRENGQSTREYTGKDLDDFIAERKSRLLEQQHIEKLRVEELGNTRNQEHTTILNIDNTANEVSDIDNANITIPEQKTKNNISTCHWRSNVLHDYEDGYREPYGYLYFIGDNKLVFSKSDQYRDTEPECRLALTIPHELADASLILGFQDQYTIKASLEEIIDKGENVELSYTDEKYLMFAALAKHDDLLVSLLTDSVDGVSRRAIAIADLEFSRINSAPKLAFESSATATIYWEIADSSVSSNFSNCLPDKLGERRPGDPLRIKANDHRFEDKLKEWYESCQPKEF